MRNNRFIHIKLLMVSIVIMIMFINDCHYIEASDGITTTPRKVIVEITKVNKEYIEIILVNTGKDYFYYWGGFTLEKLKEQKWERERHIDDITFAKTRTLEAYSTKIIRIKWRDYYGSNLSIGKYKIKLVKERTFNINDDCLIKQITFLRKFEAFDTAYPWFEGDIHLKSPA